MERILRIGAAWIAHLSGLVPALSARLDGCFPLPEGDIQLCYIVDACADEDSLVSADPRWVEPAAP